MNHVLTSSFLIIAIFLCACKDQRMTPQNPISTSVDVISTPNQNAIGATIQSRFNTPKGYLRTDEHPESFHYYLRTLPLKESTAKVTYFDGLKKSNHGVYTAVVDLPIGNKDLHQCADAVMRLRAEHLWNQKEYNRIHFNFTNGHTVAYREWMNGKRMQVSGNKTTWVDKYPPSNTYADFWNYMELIFTYAGTASLSKEMVSIKIREAKIGDVLIQGGYPGHAVIIVDQATNPNTGRSVYLLAQSYMPAQEIQVLTNPREDSSPWYTFEEGDIPTPEWRFTSNDLKRFAE